MTQAERDSNLMVVAAVVGYANSHGISAVEAFDMLRKYNVLALIRENYETLHTQSLDESVGFAEDVIARMTA
ncbi:hypothetical protein AGMMS49983_04950 [Clostridia bacterium]|nr:hypothetical protein AGMMS49983_04950 [Clostridia bacterium]